MTAKSIEPQAVHAAAAPPGEDEVVVLRDVRKRFGETEVLKGIDLVARRNETTVIIGGSGAGKTTLLRHIVALEKPTSGQIWIAGENITALGERDLNRVRKKLGMVYQYAALLDPISVFDNVAFPLVEHTTLSKKQIREKVFRAPGRTWGSSRSRVACRSTPSRALRGMRKRVGIARAASCSNR